MKDAPPKVKADGAFAVVPEGERWVVVRPCKDWQLRDACEKHLPDDIRIPALLRLSELFQLVNEAEAAARKGARKAAGIRGRPVGGVGAEVEELIAAGLFQSTARAYVARRRGLPRATVADLHQRRRKHPPK